MRLGVWSSGKGGERGLKALRLRSFGHVVGEREGGHWSHRLYLSGLELARRSEGPVLGRRLSEFVLLVLTTSLTIMTIIGISRKL